MVDNGKRGEVMQLGPEARRVGKSPGGGGRILHHTVAPGLAVL